MIKEESSMAEKSWLDEAIDWDMNGTPISRRTCIEWQCGQLALAYVEAALISQPVVSQPEGVRVERLIEACEGELEGLSPSQETAHRILFYVDYGRLP
jgi:hypothetical protein